MIQHILTRPAYYAREENQYLQQVVVCKNCGHLKDSHNGDYSFTGSPTECSEEISDDGTTCACVGANDPFVTASQRLTEIQQLKTDRREKLISEHKATPDPP